MAPELGNDTEQTTRVTAHKPIAWDLSAVRRGTGFELAAVVAASVAYLAYVFRLGSGQFRTSGLGDWIDPYFINALLEHWCYALRTLADPSSPPFFFPARHTLGYSHGLVLFALFYVPLRVFLHPFQAAAAMLFLVLETGIVCLYFTLRRFRLSFVEAFVLTAFFATSANVMNGSTAVWMQRASVFLIPSIVLLGMSARTPTLFALSGLLASLMYVQDFYSAHLTVLLATALGMATVFVECSATIRRLAAAFWDRQPPLQRVVLITTMVAVAAACTIFLTGGVEGRALGIRLAARGWQRPALLAMSGVLLILWTDRGLRDALRVWLARPSVRAFAGGAAVGAAIFLWIYLPAFQEHPAFPRDEVWKGLVDRDPYPSWRPFGLSAALAVLSRIPVLAVDRKAKLYALWLAAVSAIVLLMPLRFGEFSLWTSVFGRLPGFQVIRDPKRIIYVYELGVAIAGALLLARSRSVTYRSAAVAVMVMVSVATWNRERFDYERPNAPFDRWVVAPVAIEPQCRSFFVKPASAEYSSRSSNTSALYGTDAVFVAMRHSIPTLNGFSAWVPPGWELGYPQEETYPGRLRQWIADRRLSGVCEFDIDRRVMVRH
jgi:hypothetical protein